MSVFNVAERTMPELTDDMTVADLVDVLEHLRSQGANPPRCASIAACATFCCERSGTALRHMAATLLERAARISCLSEETRTPYAAERVQALGVGCPKQ